MNEDGIIDYLVYVVIALVTGLLGLWNTYIVGRLKKVEDTAEENADAIHGIEVGIEKRFAEHEKEERERDEAHAKEVAREFKELRRDVNEGHAAILREVNKVGRQVRNGDK